MENKNVYVNKTMYEDILNKLNYIPDNLIASHYIPDNKALVINEDELKYKPKIIDFDKTSLLWRD